MVVQSNRDARAAFADGDELEEALRNAEQRVGYFRAHLAKELGGQLRLRGKMAATEQALEALYRARYLGFVEAVATITRGYDRAHDAVQEGFARALAGSAGFRGGSLDAWVMRIVLNAAIDARRRDRDRPLDDSIPEPQLLEPDRDDAVVAALKGLSPRRRLVVFLRYFADLSYAEIAEVTGLAGGTVAATLNQAHAALREALTHPTELER